MRAKQLEGYDIQSTPPTNPRVGDRWLETAANGIPLYGWEWTWNGGHWLSPEQRWNLSSFAQTTNRIEYLDLGDRRIQVLEFQTKTLHFVAQNSTNFFRFVLYRVAANNTKTTIVDTSTIGNGTGAFIGRSSVIGGIYDLADALLEVSYFVNGSPDRFWGTVNLRYQFVR